VPYSSEQPFCVMLFISHYENLYSSFSRGLSRCANEEALPNMGEDRSLMTTITHRERERERERFRQTDTDRQEVDWIRAILLEQAHRQEERRHRMLESASVQTT